MGRFVAAECTRGPTLAVATRDLYEAFTAWATTNDEEHVSKKVFAARLEAEGFTRTRTKFARLWNGVELR